MDEKIPSLMVRRFMMGKSVTTSLISQFNFDWDTFIAQYYFFYGYLEDQNFVQDHPV
jgi:hypothetical protein